MKKTAKYIAFLSGAAIFIAAMTVTAQTGTRVQLPPATSRVPTNIKAEIDRLQAVTKTKITDLRSDIRGKVNAIQDTRRKDEALVIIGQFGRVNTMTTDHYMDVLKRLEAVLLKVETRAAKAKRNGSDMIVVERSIQRAKDAIAQARIAVNAQAKKSYQTVMNAQNIPSAGALTPEGQNTLISAMRTQFQAARNALKEDLFALRDGPVRNARTTVHDAIKALTQIPGVDSSP